MNGRILVIFDTVGATVLVEALLKPVLWAVDTTHDGASLRHWFKITLDIGRGMHTSACAAILIGASSPLSSSNSCCCVIDLSSATS